MTRTEDSDERPQNARLLEIARRLSAVVAIASLVIALGDKATQNWDRFSRLTDERISEWNALEVVAETPGSGLHLLTDTVLAATEYLQKTNAETFRLSSELKADAYLSQRISEVAWPREINASSSFVLRLEGENAICTTLFSAKGVALDRCE